jgi:hypothetical protein
MVDNSLLNTFSVEINSDDGQRYVGTFTSKKLTIRDITQLGVRRTQLCGGLTFSPETPGHGIDADTYNLNSMVAHLELAVVDAPDWWDFDKITDLTVMSEVYKEVVSFENNFPGRGHGGGSQAGSQAAQDIANTAGVSQPMVAGEVSTSLDP